MKEIITTKQESCAGCNRCVRECPMEMANITYQDDAGNIKVAIDQAKCIHCGRCIIACKHEAREYEDDTARFFHDLAAGVPISLIVAPAVRTNIPEYKRLFAYLKNMGVKKIYDVSLGADICTWAHVRHIEQNDPGPLITQPCPAIVSYCEIYRHDILDNLSPIHSPMACTAVYMKEYEGITDRIAALSPCIAKADEFEDTQLAEYNVSFAKLQQHLKNTNAQLPKHAADFDHPACGLGSIFPMPGGLKENIEFYFGNTVHVEKAEGFEVYAKLNTYAATPKELLPGIFDVLNCAEGCNIGTAVPWERNIFEISSVMKKSRSAAKDDGKRESLRALYKRYDEKLELSRFMRTYRAIATPHPRVTDQDVSQAFEMLGKNTYERQHVDCGACGSETCHNMARKIALKVNIPVNCIVKAMEDARLEHDRNVNTLELFAMIWENVESGIAIVDVETRVVLDVNPAAVRIFGGGKEKIIGEPCYKFFGLRECPVLDLNQPLDRAEMKFIKADGTEIPIMKSVSKINYNGKPALLESFSDMTPLKEAEEQKHALEVAERIQVMLDATPLCMTFFDNGLNVVDCNEEAVKMFKLSSRQEYIDRFYGLSPELQPDGAKSGKKLIEVIKKAYKEGYNRVEWMYQTLDGEAIPAEVTLVRIRYKGENLIAAYSRDLREHKRMMSEVHATTAKLDAVISNYAGIIWSVGKDGIINLFNGLYLNTIGVTPSFIEGKSLELARQKNRHLDIIERVQATMEQGPQDWISDIDGKKFHARTTPIFDESNQVTGVVGSIDDATEMIEMQERLKAENINALEQFAMIWEKVDSAMMIIDLETRIVVDANPAAVHLFGDGKDTIVGSMCYKFFGQHECPIMDLQQTIDRETRNFTKADGTVIPIIKSVSRIMYNGKPALLESFTDISYMKEADKQKSMLELGERIQVMLDVNPHINILFDSSFRIVDCNPAAIAFMGFATKEDMLAGFGERLAKSIPAVLSSGRPTRPIAEWFMVAAKEGVARFETEMILNSVRKTINVELKRIPYEESFAIVAYVFDMTQIHEREMELVRAKELNEVQLIKLHLATEAAQFGLWDIEVVAGDPLSPASKYMWSDEFRRMLGFSDEHDFPNLCSSWSDRIHPEDKEGAFASFDKHVSDTTGKTPYDAEYRLMKKNGEYAFFRDTGTTIRDEKGHAVRIAGALMDITATKNILLDTERQRIEAEAANKAKSAFLSTMSHEIRTPMNAILGITEIHLQNESLDASVKEAFNKIYVSGDMLLGIINDILDLSKIEAGKLELLAGNYEIASLLSDTAQLNMMRIGSKPIEFELRIDENLPATLFGDELRVKQILNNLLSNAFKYTGAGTVTLSVAAETCKDNDDAVVLLIRVSDTGQGMTADQIDALFEEYSRFNMEANRTTEGTGLGMSITRNLIRVMGGEIFVESEPGKGSTFTVRLPQGRTGPEKLGRELAENLHQFRTSSRAQMKRVQIARDIMSYGSVLIVDDVETNIYVAKGLLTPYGLRIDSADSGFAAIEKIKNGNVYDIVFMDHMMPKMDGVEATKIIRGMGYTRSIVALTANAVAGQAEIFLGNGFDDFISKPIDVRQLNAVLNKFVRDKQPQEDSKAVKQQVKAKNLSSSGIASKSAIDPRFAEIFVRDAAKSITALDAINKKKGPYSDDDMRTYVIHVHGMKSALANIGNMELSAVALKLEMSGRDGDIEVLSSQTTAFLDSLRAFVEELTPRKETAGDKPAEDDLPRLHENLLAIKAACGEYDEKTADTLLAALREQTWSQPVSELLHAIAEHLLHSDFDEIAAVVDRFMSGD